MTRAEALRRIHDVIGPETCPALREAREAGTALLKAIIAERDALRARLEGEEARLRIAWNTGDMHGRTAKHDDSSYPGLGEDATVRRLLAP